MTIRRTLLSALGIAVLAANGFAESQQPIPFEKQIRDEKDNAHKNNQQQAQRQPVQNQPLVYVPPMRGAPATSRLIGGGTRTLGREYPRLAVLAPRHTGLTSQAQPGLYWHISKAATAPLEFVLISDRSIEPILNVKLDSPKTTGIQKLNLSDYVVKLEIGTEYQWSIALVPNPNRRSYDIVTSGKIKRVERDKVLQNRLAESADNLDAHLFAQSGFWYDAIEAVSEQIDAHPDDQSAKENRAQLLDQVGLVDVAEHERNAARNPTRQNH